MNTGTRLAALAVAAALLSTTGCSKLRARDQLNKGVQAYKGGNFELAVEHFKNAVSYDEDLKVAKMYLATAYTAQYVPGVDTNENLRNAQQAIDTYKTVLDGDPDRLMRVNSLKGTAFLYLNMKKFDQARDYYKKAVETDPNDPELYYSLGVIAWTQAYKDAAEVKANAQMRVDDVLKNKGDEKLCEQLRAKDGKIIEDGMKMLQTAIDKRQDYDEAMAYLNLLYRRKANDFSCNDPDARAQYNKTADQWTNKMMEARKTKAAEAAKKNQGGIILEETPTPTPSPSR
jgi:tetratricopeptide (TPR) repeat protein